MQGDVINCLCGDNREDGTMVECETCKTWQHGYCAGFGDDIVDPEYRYICISCDMAEKHENYDQKCIQSFVRYRRLLGLIDAVGMENPNLLSATLGTPHFVKN